METIMKGLEDFLEQKRVEFPRFFFMSNEELFQLLAESKDSVKMQRHLPKLFDNIAKLSLESP